jgi:hypothetical protein
MWMCPSNDRVVILYREASTSAEELAAASRHFPCVKSRLDLRSGDTVISRYGALPFYKEQAEDIDRLGAHLINSLTAHRYVSDLYQWYRDVGPDLTPRTWAGLDEFEDAPEGEYVVKGATYSRKHDWATHMYAPNREAVRTLFSTLQRDPLVGQDRIYIREYVPLRSHGEMPSGLPVSHEFRFIILDGVIVAGGFYWSEHLDRIGYTPQPSEVPQDFLRAVIDRVGLKCHLWSLDVAQKRDGSWAAIDLGDAQMAGTCTIDVEDLYARLARTLRTGNPD